MRLSHEQFDDLYRELTGEIQGVFAARFGHVMTQQHGDACVAALGSVAALFLIQTPDRRAGLDRIIEATMVSLRANPDFTAGVEAVKAGRQPEPEIGLASPLGAPKHSDECLACAIGDLVRSRLGDPMPVEKVDDALRSLAAAVAVFAMDYDPIVVVPAFIHHLNDFVAAVMHRNSTDGMTKQ